MYGTILSSFKLLESIVIDRCGKAYVLSCSSMMRLENKGNNKITELRTILQRESQNA
jgi:hypothetical protein